MNYIAQRPIRGNGGSLDTPRFVEDIFNRLWSNPIARQEAWQPAVDILETPQAYELRIEIPGIDPDEVNLTLLADTLTIKGEKLLDEKAEQETWYARERSAGTFERRFTFPTAVSAKSVEAEAKNGILTIHVMKATEAQPQKVSIRKS